MQRFTQILPPFTACNETAVSRAGLILPYDTKPYSLLHYFIHPCIKHGCFGRSCSPAINKYKIFVLRSSKFMNWLFFLIQQFMWIPSGAMVTDGLDCGRGVEQQCVVVEDRTAGAQHRHRHFSSQYIRLSESFCCWEKMIKVLLIISYIPQILQLSVLVKSVTSLQRWSSLIWVSLRTLCDQYTPKVFNNHLFH